MPTFWFGVVVERIPEEFVDGVVLAEGIDEDGDIASESLRYAILARVGCSTRAEAERLITSAVQDCEPSMCFLVADRAEAVTRSERLVAQSLKENDVSLKASFLAFSRESEAARMSALRILEQAVKRKWWQVWR